MSFVYEKKDRLRRAAVYVKYMLPLICALWMVIGCALCIFRLSNDDTKRVRQSVYELAKASAEQSKVTLEHAEVAEKNSIALAKSLRTGTAAMWIVTAAVLFFSLVLAAFALYTWLLPPDSDGANLLKIRMKYVFPGRWLQFLLPYLAMIPLGFPYYVIDKFETYYRVKDVSATKAEYFDYSIDVRGVNPLIVSAILAVVSSVVFAAVMAWEKGYGLDMFRTYKKDDWYKGEEL